MCSKQPANELWLTTCELKSPTKPKQCKKLFLFYCFYHFFIAGLPLGRSYKCKQLTFLWLSLRKHCFLLNKNFDATISASRNEEGSPLSVVGGRRRWRTQVAKEEKRCIANSRGIINSTTMAIMKEVTMTVMAEPVVMASERVSLVVGAVFETESQPCPNVPSVSSCQSWAKRSA